MLSSVRRLVACATAVSTVVLLGSVVTSAMAAAPSGGYLAVLNEARNFGDSRNSISFFSTSDLTQPLFSVYVGRENAGSNEWEEPDAITVDPETGDIYFVAFDSGTPLTPDPVGDTQGDLDLYKMHFATIFDDWSTKYQGHDVRGESLVTAGPAPSGTNNASNLDYVTYSAANDFNFTHSNQVVLAGAVEKIGEVARNLGGDAVSPFYTRSLQFVDQDTLFMIDDSVGQAALDDPVDDHAYRILRRVDTVPGSAMTTIVDRSGIPASSYYNGGNNGTGNTESWESELIDFVSLDGAGHSEPLASAFYDAGSVRGAWVVERDMPTIGDTIVFEELASDGSSNGYRAIDKPGNPFIITMRNDPFNEEMLPSPPAPAGRVDKVFVDQDSGDLIVIESGFGDTPEQEPAVIRLGIDSYDNGSGQISLGDWSEKVFLDPEKDPDDLAGGFLQRGYWSAYDSANDLVYFFNPTGDAASSGNPEVDIHVLDLNTQMTTSYMNVDDSYTLFSSGSFGDSKTLFFSIAAAGLLGDYNEDNVIDGADYTAWRDAMTAGATSLPNDPTPGVVDESDFLYWRAHYGEMLGPGSGAGAGLASVPEPGSLTLLALGLVGLWAGRRKRS